MKDIGKTLELIKQDTEHEIVMLYETVRDYESDTFSASASKLTEDEAAAITAALINHALKRLSDCDTLDGIRLTEELEEIRD